MQKIYRAKFFKWTLWLTIISSILLFLCYKKVSWFAAPYLYDDVTQVPYHKAALLLGTSKNLQNGSPNLFFKSRIDEAVQLYKAGKVKYIIASGDNSVVNYNEPEQMKQSMMEQGVPDSAIVLDYAGFRTFDSIIRCEEIFGQSSFVIISQKFHNERALYIARKKGMDAIAFNAADPQGPYIKNKLREILARVKVLLDIHVFATTPKFGGERIELK